MRALQPAAELHVKYLSFCLVCRGRKLLRICCARVYSKKGSHLESSQPHPFARLGVVFQTKSLFVHRKFGVLPQHATNKSVICGCCSFCKIHLQVVLKSMHRSGRACSFGLLPVNWFRVESNKEFLTGVGKLVSQKRVL
jgi:hypothetical protein